MRDTSTLQPSRVFRRDLFALGLLALCGSAASQTPTYTWNGSAFADHLGSTVALVGDVDGDGVRDVAIGAPDADYFFPLGGSVTNRGNVRIYSGATGASLHTWWGSSAGNSEFGYAIADAGDVNNDGHDDVVVGIPRGILITEEIGLVQLRSGADGSVISTAGGAQPHSRFGHALASGQIDGSFRLEIIVGSPHYDKAPGSTQGGPGKAGRVNVLLIDINGNMSSIDTTEGSVFSDSFGAYFVYEWGASVAYAGDTNNDTLGEIVVGAPATDYLSMSGLNNKNASGYARHFQPGGTGVFAGYTGSGAATASGDRLGSAVAVLSDADGDGKVNIAVGLPGHDIYGQVRIYSGSNTLLHTLDGTSTWPIGSVLASSGDISGDGVRDLVVGSPLADVGSPAMQNAGRVTVHSGVDASVVRTLDGAGPTERFGAAVSAGDIDGQGLDELLIGVPFADVNASNAGAAELFDGEDCGHPGGTSLYGEGLAGTLGVPALAALGGTGPGTLFQLDVDNSAGQLTLGYLFLGFAPQSLNVKGGTLLVNVHLLQPISLPVNGKLVNLPIPPDPQLCGVSIYAQVLELDPGAVRGVSFTRGMQLTIGD